MKELAFGAVLIGAICLAVLTSCKSDGTSMVPCRNYEMDVGYVEVCEIEGRTCYVYIGKNIWCESPPIRVQWDKTKKR